MAGYPAGFSCSNLVAAALKDFRRVTIIGRQTGGGTSTVQTASSPWDTCFQMSSSIVVSVLRNGSLNDIDKEVVRIIISARAAASTTGQNCLRSSTAWTEWSPERALVWP